LTIVGARDSRLDRPGYIERTLVYNLSSKIAAIPMMLTSVGIFIVATLWTVYHSFTNSRMLPKSEFIGLAQYERLWSSDRWYMSIENLAIYGACSLVFSLFIGFLLAALLDQKTRFENTFRTIFLYPFALSFIVTGLVWQWILNPEYGVEKIVRSLGFESFVFNPFVQYRYSYLRNTGSWFMAGYWLYHVPYVSRVAWYRSRDMEGRQNRWNSHVENLHSGCDTNDAPNFYYHFGHYCCWNY
jgi:ABC-type sugar transport system permease subunit